MASRLTKVEHAIVGNGNHGLLTRVALAEEAIKQISGKMDKMINALWAAAATFSIAVTVEVVRTVLGH
jgi:hypothetical protein